MSERWYRRSLGGETAAILCAVAAAVLYAAAMAILYPYRNVFSFDPDEGINAVKALLVDRGFALYSQIWNDQPPLFTHLLRVWLHVLGWDVNTGRLLVLTFAAIGVFALYDLVRLVSGHSAAVAACVLLAASAYFPRLSVSIMVGLPAITFAILALWALFRWRRRQHRNWLAAAGVLMGCSLACKLATAILLPVFGTWLAFAAPRDAAGRRGWRAAGMWLLCVGITAGGLLFTLVGPAHLPALVSSHVVARQAESLQRFGPLGLVVTGLAEWPLTLLGLGAYVLLILRRNVLAAVFPAWAGAAAVGLLSHTPVWYHHQLLLTVPHCAAAGIILAELFRRDRSGRQSSAALRLVAALLVAALLGWTMLGDRLPAPKPLAGTPERMLARMRRLASVTRVVLATDAMYAFRAGYPVPPALAVMSLKRVATDPQLEEEIRSAFAQDSPEQIVLTRGAGPELSAWVRESMADRYLLVVSDGGTELFVRKDLRPSARRGGARNGGDSVRCRQRVVRRLWDGIPLPFRF